MALLERLRVEEPSCRQTPGRAKDAAISGAGPRLRGVTLELHDGTKWHAADVADMGVGGARPQRLARLDEGGLRPHA